MRARDPVVLCAIAALAGACAGDPSSHDGGMDGAIDARTDARTDSRTDARTDVPSDVPTGPRDTGVPESCDAPRQRCDGVCVDPQSDRRNCGACGVACARFEQCAAGRCECQPGATQCGSTCVNTTFDTEHCGGCNQRCAAGSLCLDGVCSCAPGTALCGGSACITVAFEPERCGSGCGRCAGLCENATCAAIESLALTANATTIELSAARRFSGALAGHASTIVADRSPGFVSTLASRTLSAGAGHLCAITRASGVECVGLDNYGQCRTPSSIAWIQSVSAGGFHTCVMHNAGEVRCFGANRSGQCGQPPSPSATWSSVALTGALRLSAGSEHTCALTESGVRCWGDHSRGQLGSAATGSGATPVVVAGITGTVSGLSAGGSASCAWNTDGQLFCWGSDGLSELGDNGASAQGSTRRIIELSNVTAASVGGNALGSHVCAIANERVYCWGNNASGQTGDRSAARRTAIPTLVQGLPTDITAVRAGVAHTCAISRSRGAMCWGDNGRGQLADGTTVSRAIPQVTRAGI